MNKLILITAIMITSAVSHGKGYRGWLVYEATAASSTATIQYKIAKLYDNKERTLLYKTSHQPQSYEATGYNLVTELLEENTEYVRSGNKTIMCAHIDGETSSFNGKEALDQVTGAYPLFMSICLGDSGLSKSLSEIVAPQ